MGDWMQEKKERSEEVGMLLYFIAQSLPSGADRYWSTKGDERLGLVCKSVDVDVCIYI